MAPAGFYVTYRKKVGEQTTADGVVYTRYKYFAQRWEPVNDKWAASARHQHPRPADPHLEVGAAAGERGCS